MRLQFKKSENYLKHHANLDDLGNFLINTVYQNWLKEKWKSWIDSYPTVISVLKSTERQRQRNREAEGDKETKREALMSDDFRVSFKKQ